jgi:GT2 family glycosyltransferase
MKRASVVVPTLGRLALLTNCLEGIRRQSYSDYELLVIHDSSNVGPVKDLVGACGGKYLQSPKRGCVPTYNTGLGAASGDIVAFTDDDAVPDGSWLSHLVESYGPGVGAVGGTVIEASRPRALELVSSEIVPVDHLSGANMSFERKAIVKTGVFDYNYAGDGFRFESDYCIRVKRKGFAILFNPRARVIHFGSRVRRVPKGWNARRAYYYNRNDTYFSLRNHAVAKTANYVIFDTNRGMATRIVNRARNMTKKALVRQDSVWLFSLIGLISGIQVYSASRHRNLSDVPQTSVYQGNNESVLSPRVTPEASKRR